MLTTRDYDIVEFVKKFKICSTTTIANEFFPSLSACQKRLKVIADNNLLKRIRDNFYSQYVYFHKLPNQFRHSFLVSEFYRELTKKCKVTKFKIEPQYDRIRPDASFVYYVDGISKVGLLEVELSNKGFDFKKYEHFISTNVYRNFMTIPPKVFIVGDVKTNSNNYVSINKDLSNLRVV